MIKKLTLEDCNKVATPGIKTPDDEDETQLDPTQGSKYTQIVARLNYLAQDRCDIQYAVKELAKFAADPTTSARERLKRLGKFISNKPRYVIVYKPQSNLFAVNGMTDSDWAGDKTTRRSTNAGAC